MNFLDTQLLDDAATGIQGLFQEVGDYMSRHRADHEPVLSRDRDRPQVVGFLVGEDRFYIRPLGA